MRYCIRTWHSVSEYLYDLSSLHFQARLSTFHPCRIKSLQLHRVLKFGFHSIEYLVLTLGTSVGRPFLEK